MSDTMRIEANSLEEAIDKADKALLNDGEYMNNSFRVERHHIEYMHDDEEIKQEARAYVEENGEE